MEKVIKNKMDTSKIGKLLFGMAIPLIFSMIVQSLYNIFDSMFVSFIPDNKVSFQAVSLATSIQQLMIAVSTGIGVGMNALLSKSLGEKNQKKVNLSFRCSILLILIAGIIFFILAFFLPELFLKTQTGSIETIKAGVTYLRIVMMGSVFLFFQVLFERSLQSTGKTNLSMIVQLTGAIINIILDPIFIFTFNLNIAGAAYATIIGQFIASIVGLLLNIKCNKDISFNKETGETFIDGSIINKILKVGIPSMIMVAIFSFLMFGINSILNSFTEINGENVVKDAQNAFRAYFKLQSFVFMPVFGLNNALVPIVAFNYGSKNKGNMKKAFKYAIISAVSYMILGCIVFELFPHLLLKIFNAEGSMLEFGITTLRILALSFPIAGISLVISSWFQALGNGVFSMIISIARQLIFLLPIALLLALSGDIQSIWWAFPIAEIAGLICSVLLYCLVNKKIVSKIE